MSKGQIVFKIFMVQGDFDFIVCCEEFLKLFSFRGFGFYSCFYLFHLGMGVSDYILRREGGVGGWVGGVLILISV